MFLFGILHPYVIVVVQKEIKDKMCWDRTTNRFGKRYIPQGKVIIIYS